MTVISKRRSLSGGLFLIFLLLVKTTFSQIIVPTAGCSPVENFDNANPWTFGGTNSSWVWANPNKQDVTDDITMGGKALILGGNTPTSTYNQSEDSWAESPVYDLTNVNNPYLSFYFYWSNEGSTSFDEIWIEYSLNNGASWSDLAAPVGTGTCYDQNWYNYPDNWGGNNGGCFPGLGGPTGWVQVRKCISNLGNESSVKFRFRISTGTTCQNFGATIDEFKVCDVSIKAEASYECTSQPLEIEFTDMSYDCPTNWFWDFGDNTSSSVQHPIHVYTNPGLYTVSLTVATNNSVTGGCGGPYQDTYVFDVEVMATSATITSHVSCFGGNDGGANINLIGGGTSPTYLWVPAPGNGQGTNTGTDLQAGNYTVSITGTNPTCVASASLVINEPNEILEQLTSTDASCISTCDGSLSAVVTGGTPLYTVSWMPGNLIGANVNNVCTGTYSATITDANGCQNSMGNPVQVASPLTPAINPIPDYKACEGDIISIADFLVNTVTNVINWEIISGSDIGFGINGAGNIGSFTADPVIDSAIVNIEVTPISGTNCTGLPDTFSIKIFAQPSPDFSALYVGACEPLKVTFNVTGASTDSDYEWNIGSAQYYGSSINHYFSSGSYTISLMETTNAGCINEMIKEDFIVVNSKPVADFSFSPGYYIEEGSIVQFRNLSLNASNYEWKVDDLNLSSTDKDVDFELYDVGNGFLKINLAVSNANGCFDSVSKFIQLREPEIIYIPNAFSPSGGHVNRQFTPIIQSGVDIYKYKLTIYNRWGETVFISYNPEIGWDGTLLDGSLAISGVYVYKIDYNSPYLDNPKDIIETVTLVD